MQQAHRLVLPGELVGARMVQPAWRHSGQAGQARRRTVGRWLSCSQGGSAHYDKGGQRRGALDLVLNEVLNFICADLGVIVHLSISSALSMLEGYVNACSRSRVSVRARGAGEVELTSLEAARSLLAINMALTISLVNERRSNRRRSCK